MSHLHNTQSSAQYEVTIGIEVHVQLNTKSKIFCTSPNCASSDPNSNICPVCAGHPGVLPVLNQEVVDSAIMAGLATNCTINTQSEFARKHYFYPDLPKNYQITQSDKPICSEGFITIHTEDGTPKKVRIMRIHIEEDAGKNIHAPESNESFVDLNRAGTPLLEIVTHPDIASSYEAKAYLKTLRSLVMYLKINTGNMEEGALRADTNVSVRKKGQAKLGTRCELKNINSFKFIGDAVDYEVTRQIALLESGEQVRQETRSWDTKEHKTVTLRTKEEAADYRYFPDPDLPLIVVTQEHTDAIKCRMPELPTEKLDRLQKNYGLTAYEADILINDQELSNYFEQAAQKTSSKQVINWVLRDIMKLVKDQKIALEELKITPERLAELITLLEMGVINNRAAQEVFEDIAQTGASAQDIVKQKGLEQIGSSEELEKLVKSIVEANPQEATEYRGGRERLFGFFVGQAMAKTKGKGNPQIINELLKKYLKR